MKKRVVVRDELQDGYTYYCTELPGKNFHPDFRPMLTPAEMLALGVFCGNYMRNDGGEFPRTWFANAKLAQGGRDDCALNYFGVKASQPRSVWQEKGWMHEDDPRGWFQWYCRYYMGRRHEDDSRQIKRWNAFRRHIAQVKNNCEPGDRMCRRVQKQALLHWAYDSRKL